MWWRPRAVKEHRNMVSASLGERLECNLPIAVRHNETGAWYASMELPRELMELPADALSAVLDTVKNTLNELRRLNEQTGGPPGLLRQPWLMVNCGLWIRRGPGGAWRTSVVFTWPDIWGDFDRDGRKAILNAVDVALEDTRALLQEHRDTHP